jgi:hypothetical protein
MGDLDRVTPGEAELMGPDTDSSCDDELSKFLNQRGGKSAKKPLKHPSGTFGIALQWGFQDCAWWRQDPVHG